MAEVMAQTAPPLQGPSEKERKYDRQLRLWAASGQAALESANILLVNSGAGTVGVETLKNLVLPGIGKFTIADHNVVGPADLGVNFFLDADNLGKSRAECCTRLLVELNPEVQGDWYPKAQDSYNLQNLLASNSSFTMVLYALPLPQDQVRLIHDYGREHGRPVIAVHSVGFYSYFRTYLPGTFPIVDTHPDETATTDLRLLNPWPELVSFARDMTHDLDNLGNHEHGHLPLVVILLYFLENWQQNHGGALPTSYADKTAFRETVSNAMRRDNPEGGEENFEEAVAAVMKHVTLPPIPSSLQQVFEYQPRSPAEAKSSFWIIAQAVKRFSTERGCLPVPGALPDMKAQSGVYIRLQNLYKEKARQDAAVVLEMVRGVPAGEDVDATEVELFCKNARFIKLINHKEHQSDIKQVIDQELANNEVAAIAGPEMPLSLIPVYMALTATSHSATASTQSIMDTITQQAPTVSKNEHFLHAAKELARAAGGELHNTSAVMGGMVAQEMIKIITQQYVPIDNTCIFDGIESRCQVLRL